MTDCGFERLVRQVRRRVIPTAHERPSGHPQSEAPAVDLSEASKYSSMSRTELFLETGLTPEEYILHVVRSEGEIRQQQLDDILGWSQSSVSRLLCQMEEEGVVERVRANRGKVVTLSPDADG
ncbi:hypothetical protein BRC89_03700 [Halobacteriales archaeon QS_4_70_19]|nr:MAG: hypothetical protein BRC89_03700 [Halobacteriales archaeon QS_4_70_19]